MRKILPTYPKFFFGKYKQYFGIFMALLVAVTSIGISYFNKKQQSTDTRSDAAVVGTAVNLNIQSTAKTSISDQIWGTNIFYDHDSNNTDLYGKRGITMDRSEYGYFNNDIPYDRMLGLGAKSLRYPYGCVSQVYNWRNGTLNYKFFGAERLNLPYGTIDEMLQLATDTGSDLNFIVNIEYHTDGSKYKPCNFEPKYPRKSDAENRAILVQDAKDLVTRYKGRLKTFEIGNEEWASWNPQEYIDMAITVAQSMKSVDPTIKLRIQSSYLTMPNAQEWNTKVTQTLQLQCGSVNCFDSVTAHMYFADGYDKNIPVSTTNYKGKAAFAAAALYPQKLNTLKTVSAGKPLAITEYGVDKTCVYDANAMGQAEAGLHAFEALRAFVDAGVSVAHANESLYSICGLLLRNDKNFSYAGKVQSLTSNAAGGTVLNSAIPTNVYNNNGALYRTMPLLSQFTVKKGNDLFIFLDNKHDTNDYKVQLNFDSGVNISQYKVAEVETITSTAWDTSIYSDKTEFTAPQNGMQIIVPKIGMVRVRLATRPAQELAQSYMYSRNCEFDYVNGTPSNCSSLVPLEIERLRGGTLSSYGAFETFIFNNQKSVRQSFISSDGKKFLFRNCRFNPGSGESICNTNFTTTESTGVRNNPLDTFSGYTIVKFTVGDLTKIRLYYLLSGGDTVHIKECRMDETTGIVDATSCISVSNWNISSLRGTTGEKYSGMDFFLFNNNTKLRQSFVTLDGKRSYFRNCDFNVSTGQENCAGSTFNTSDYTNLRGNGNESYIGYANNIYLYNDKYHIRQDFIGGNPGSIPTPTPSTTNTPTPRISSTPVVTSTPRATTTPTSTITVTRTPTPKITLTPVATTTPTKIPTPTVTLLPQSPTPPTGTPTKIPTPTITYLPQSPTPPSGTATPPPCTLKSKGDANCDKSIDLLDFEVFRQEFIKFRQGTLDINTAKADFNSDKSVDIIDFATFREGYLLYKAN